MRIVEVEKAPCQHLHTSNYDPARVAKGEPVQVLGDGRMWCFDCKEFFTYPPSLYSKPLPPSSPSYTLAELEALAKEFVAEYPARGDSQWLMSLWLAWLGKKEREGGE